MESASVPSSTPGAASSAPTSLEQLPLPARLEAILYLKGKPLSLAELAELSGCSRDEVELGLLTLMADYAHRTTALEIVQDGPRYSL